SVLLVQMEAPPNLGAEYTRRFHDNYGAVAAAEGATLLPFLLDGVAGVRRLNQGDGIHPTADGAKRVAGNVWPSLGPILSRLAKPGMTG
ncbi:MAG TPA: arylesterase, partial [Gemmatimonadaceae bacterium]|nr:arylesterase [Gemmatimonadaceae bacterium]